MTQRSPSSPSLFCAAVIASAHGVRGHVKVKCFLENPGKFITFSPFFSAKGEEAFWVEKVVSQNKDVLIISFKDISDRNQAEKIRGEDIVEIKTLQGKFEMNPFTKDFIQDLRKEEGEIVVSPDGEDLLKGEKVNA